jgi:hypothetical protein
VAWYIVVKGFDSSGGRIDGAASTLPRLACLEVSRRKGSKSRTSSVVVSLRVFRTTPSLLPSSVVVHNVQKVV